MSNVPNNVTVAISQVNEDNTGMKFALTPVDATVPGSVSEHTKYAFTVDASRRYQTMDGFGASFTEGSAYLTQRVLSESARQELMTRLFDKEDGIGISMLRQPIGSSDHVRAPYSYVDEPEADDLPGFTLEPDLESVIPSLQQALRVNPGRASVMAATWSPPGWMKANHSELGNWNGVKGTLKPDKYDAYAHYIAKFIKGYAELGIPVYATSIQNEPLHDSHHWPAMYFSGAEEAAFIKHHLVPIFEQYGIDTQILCFDHNFNLGKDYIHAVYNDPEVSKHVAGSAWHWYGGSETVMSEIHEQFPDKGIWFTEGSGGQWNPMFRWRDGFITQMRSMIRYPRNWAKSVIWWNVALDENNGPDYYYVTYMKCRSTCRGLVTIRQDNGEVEYNADYYTLGHASKFVDPGAHRIESNTFMGEVESVAYENPDGSKVAILFNGTDTDQEILIRQDDCQFAFTLPAEAGATCKW